MTNFQEEQRLKREHEIARKEAAGSRTPQEQLARLDARLGPRVGARRERERLMKRLIAENAPYRTPLRTAEEDAANHLRIICSKCGNTVRPAVGKGVHVEYIVCSKCTA